MNLAIVGPVYPYRGGIAHYTSLTAQALAQSHQVLVVSFHRQYPGWLYPGKTDRDSSRQPLQVEAEYSLDPLYPWTWLQSAKRIIKFQPDGVVIQWWTTFWAPAFASLAYLLHRKGIPVLFIIHNVLPHEPHFFDPFLARLALRQGQIYITGTRQEQERLERLLPGARAIVCSHPVYDMFTSQKTSKEEARRRLGLPKDACLALQFGIVRPYKGLKYLIEAAALLRQQGTEVHILAAGEFWDDKNTYIEQAQHSGISDLLHLEDRYIPNEEVAVYFSAADVFAAPYIEGTQSGAMKMALGFGLPVITTYTLADAESGESGSLLYRIPPRDAPALAEALRKILSTEKIGTGTPPQNNDWEGLGAIIVENLANARQEALP